MNKSLRQVRDTAREIRAALRANTFGTGPEVHATDEYGRMRRIHQVRIRIGVLQGRNLQNGKWAEITEWKVQP